MILPPDGPPEGVLAALRLDRRNPMHAHERILHVMLREYSFSEPRGFPALKIGQLAGVKHDDVLRFWTMLVEWGYLIEHPREHERAPRRFVLVDRRTTGREPEQKAA